MRCYLRFNVQVTDFWPNSVISCKIKCRPIDLSKAGMGLYNPDYLIADSFIVLTYKYLYPRYEYFLTIKLELVNGLTNIV